MSHKPNHIKRKTPARWVIPLGIAAVGIFAKLYNEASPIAIESDACRTGVSVIRTINPILFRLLKYRGSFQRRDSGNYAISTVPPTMKVRVTGQGKYVNMLDLGDGMTAITLEAKNNKGGITESLR